MTLVGTSVIIDARDPGSLWHAWAREQIAEAAANLGAYANTIVIAEASVRVQDRENFPEHLEALGLTLVALPLVAAAPAARAYSQYLDRLKSEGKIAASKIPLGDFLIGAHAEAEGMTLLTRDPSRVRTYFPGVQLIIPA